MQIDKNYFFREATLRICSSLEIEKALWDCFMYIREYIPADSMLIDIYDPIVGLGETIAKADLSGGKLISIKTVAPAETKKLIKEMRKNLEMTPKVLVADRIGDHPIMGPMSEIIGHPDSAFMAIWPNPEWGFVAGILVGNNRGEKYSEKHIQLFTLLNEPFTIALSNFLRYREVLRLKEILADDNRYLQEELRQQAGEEIVGARFGLKQVMEMVGQVAPLTSPVLLLGETGTGKEVIATALHNLSLRRNGPFIKVNCGAIPESLMDSELFGHEKGAFTGAFSQKRGRFERAQGGTIFLDEIGELTPGAQIRLLRVIHEKEIERVGGSETIKVDIRIIAATHRNLEAMLAEGKFRTDLYFRLRVFPIVIPPLCDRRADIPALVQYFMVKKTQELGFSEVPSLAPGAIEKLMNYNWPGNVRELQNTIEHALILSREKPLAFDNLSDINPCEETIMPQSNERNPQSLEQAMSHAIVNALNMTGGRVDGEKGAAKLLKINPSTLRTKMRKLGIRAGSIRAK
ncbi:MAG: AAA family ATPase [Desulfobacterium sp.]|nr:AAA family ATPase [Desulfobacterium sp.]MBU3949366.1 sigma 54-interacting transcriptional regulator [Pseudomonadota bacterium]MBU4010497.1 sigma 54-interacting transcriptional regulator [Pseudomonadota bacterium]MBU4035087.1 sigma 54-interacting transcriptional regulator [Pseudomonadota bacterium]